MANSYEDKLERRRERLEDAADRARSASSAALNRSHQMTDAIPMGQPILVGHYSEHRDRRYRDRAWNLLGKGVEEGKKAEEYARRANAVGTAGISSDDPEAVEKLQAQLGFAEALQAQMKAANAAIRKAGVARSYPRIGNGNDHERPSEAVQAKAVAALVTLGLSEKAAHALLVPDFCGEVGFANYALTNNNANIHRLKGRIADLQRSAERPAMEPIDGDGWRIFDDADENRTCIEFDAKPADAIRTKLKAEGFRWSHFSSRWQRMRSLGAWFAAKRAMGVA